MPGRLTNLGKRLRGVAIVGLCGAIIAACGIGGTVGGGNIQPEIGFRVQGTPNTPFTALITDTLSSWTVNSVTPVSIVLLNDNPPVRIFATKLTSNSSLLTVQAVLGGAVDLSLASTSAPFGTVVTQTGMGIDEIAPPADPDTRFFVKGSAGESFNGIIEDLHIGFALDDFVRTIFLFEHPSGRVTGMFDLTSADEGPLEVDLSIGGAVVANASGNPSVQVKSP